MTLLRHVITALALSCVLVWTTPSADASPTVTLPAGFAHRTVTANGQQLHLVMGGKGDPIVLLHGWPEIAIGAEHGNGAVVGTTMKLLAKHVTAMVIPEAAHFLPELQPDLIAKKILAF